MDLSDFERVSHATLFLDRAIKKTVEAARKRNSAREAEASAIEDVAALMLHLSVNSDADLSATLSKVGAVYQDKAEMCKLANNALDVNIDLLDGLKKKTAELRNLISKYNKAVDRATSNKKRRGGLKSPAPIPTNSDLESLKQDIIRSYILIHSDVVHFWKCQMFMEHRTTIVSNLSELSQWEKILDGIGRTIMPEEFILSPVMVTDRRSRSVGSTKKYVDRLPEFEERNEVVVTPKDMSIINLERGVEMMAKQDAERARLLEESQRRRKRKRRSSGSGSSRSHSRSHSRNMSMNHSRMYSEYTDASDNYQTANNRSQYNNENYESNRTKPAKIVGYDSYDINVPKSNNNNNDNYRTPTVQITTSIIK